MNFVFIPFSSKKTTMTKITPIFLHQKMLDLEIPTLFKLVSCNLIQDVDLVFGALRDSFYALFELISP
jgi:hypothetical protein